MPYDRQYTLEEVHTLLYESENRPSPKTGAPGHTLGLHADMRKDVADKRASPVIYLGSTIEETRAMDPKDAFGSVPAANPPAKDGRFLRRKDLVLAVHEALNSAGGKQELRKLNGTESRVTIVVAVSVHQGKLRAAVCQHPTINTGSGKKKKPVIVAGTPFYQEGFVQTVTVIVDKFPPPNLECRVHIQTAYPKL